MGPATGTALTGRGAPAVLAQSPRRAARPPVGSVFQGHGLPLESLWPPAVLPEAVPRAASLQCFLCGTRPSPNVPSPKPRRRHAGIARITHHHAGRGSTRLTHTAVVKTKSLKGGTVRCLRLTSYLLPVLEGGSRKPRGCHTLHSRRAGRRSPHQLRAPRAWGQAAVTLSGTGAWFPRQRSEASQGQDCRGCCTRPAW